MLKKKLTTQWHFTPLEKPGRTIVHKNRRFLTGFTLSELMITITTSIIVIAGVGFAIVDSQRGWNRMYNRVYSDVVTDGYVARKRFDAVIRKASWKKVLLDEDGNWIEVYYYADGNSTVLDRYARFYTANGQLNIEYGKLNPKETLTTQTVCGNVSNCTFKVVSRSAQMILTLDNGSQTVSVTSSSVMHNQ